MQPHIIQIIPTPTGGGAEVLVRELGQSIASENFTSEVIYFNSNIKLKKNIQYHENESELGVSSRNFFAIFKLRSILKKRILEYDDVLVHAHLTWPFYFVALATLFLNVKLIYTEHSTVNKRRKIPLLRYIERLIYARYSRIICISAGVERSLAPWVGQALQARLVIVPNGSRIYSMVDRAQLADRKPRLVSVGSLTSRKNFTTALRAVAEVKDQVESYAIVGEGPERQRLEHLIRDMGLEDIVTLVGWSDQIDKYLQSSDIQVIPSLWEGFGLVAVEGMSTGICVVASNVDGLRDVLGQNNPAVTLVDDIENVQSWIKGLKLGIQKLRADTDGELAAAARKQAEQFTMEAMADRYLEVYESLSVDDPGSF
jgi:hypothetical protein